MRVFEGMAAGALMVTDAIRRNGLEDLFTPGEHLVTYASEAELFERLDYYLAHEPERRAIAERGRALVLRRDTYEQRARQLTQTLAGRSARPAAGAQGAPLDALERMPPGGRRARDRMAAEGAVAAVRAGGPAVTRDIVLATRPRPACYLCGREGLVLHDRASGPALQRRRRVALCDSARRSPAV